MFKIKWPQEHDDALRALLADPKTAKWSFGDLAALLNERFNSSYSRNAVIGRANRLGLERKPRRARKRTATPDEKLKIAARSNLPTRYLRQTVPPKIVCDAPIAPMAEPRAFGVPLIEVEGCRWPSGDGIAVAFTFCNAAKRDGFSYCAGHVRLSLRHAA